MYTSCDGPMLPAGSNESRNAPVTARWSSSAEASARIFRSSGAKGLCISRGAARTSASMIERFSATATASSAHCRSTCASENASGSPQADVCAWPSSSRRAPTVATSSFARQTPPLTPPKRRSPRSVAIGAIGLPPDEHAVPAPPDTVQPAPGANERRPPSGAAWRHVLVRARSRRADAMAANSGCRDHATDRRVTPRNTQNTAEIDARGIPTPVALGAGRATVAVVPANTAPGRIDTAATVARMPERRGRPAGRSRG
eukprot:ctg_2719.g592